DRAARHTAGGTTSCAGSRASSALSSRGGLLRQGHEIRRCVLVEIHYLLGFERRRVEYFDCGVSKEIQLLAVAAHGKSHSSRAAVKFFLLHDLVVLEIPHPPLRFPVSARTDFGHHRITAFPVRRKLEVLHREKRADRKVVDLASSQIDMCHSHRSFVDDWIDSSENGR